MFVHFVGLALKVKNVLTEDKSAEHKYYFVTIDQFKKVEKVLFKLGQLKQAVG